MAKSSGPRVGRRPSTTQDHITSVALELFASHGFDEVSVDDVARAAGIARRTLFRYYPSKNAIPWGDFDAHLNLMRELLAEGDQRGDIAVALRTALLAFNRFDDEERHRQRMRLILGTDALQAHSMTMYAGWRTVVAELRHPHFPAICGVLVGMVPTRTPQIAQRVCRPRPTTSKESPSRCSRETDSSASHCS